MNESEQPSSSAVNIAWNLSDLYSGIDDPAIDRDLSAAMKRAEGFAAAYRGKIAGLRPDDADLVLTSVRELESLSEQMDKSSVFAGLVHAAQSEDPRHGALLSRTREQRTAINKHLIFFDLEWIQLSDDTAQKLTTHPKLERYRHFLELKRAWKPHYLSEPEEKLLDEKAITGKMAFGRLFEETISSLKFPYPAPSPLPLSPGTPGERGRGERDILQLSLQEILAKLYDPDREVRRLAAEGLSSTLNDNSRLLTFIFNNIVLDHQSDTQLRHFSSPMASRNLANETTDKVVDALMSAAEKHYELVRRYYRLKGKLLKIDRLRDYDRYAPLAPPPPCDWQTARRIVTDSYQAFSPRAGTIIREFFDKQWIDAELRPGKRSGAFSASGVPSVHPYILMNFTDRIRDVMTLAHELGHGLHQYLSRGQGYLQCDTPLTMAETASVFGEMLTFQQLLVVYPDPKVRLAMLCGKIEDSFATVFRQVVLTRFELDLHKARAEQGELSGPVIGELWQNANRKMFGDVVEMTDGYSCWWSYIGHFIRSPFYCYAYAFGELLVLALYQKYRQDGPAFVPRYLDLLAAGGSAAPDVLLQKMGVDVNDPGFWELGLQLLGDMVTEAEKLANLT
jgi:oligoendopeptidase F